MKRLFAGLIIGLSFISSSSVFGDQGLKVSSLCAEWIRASDAYQHELSAAATVQERNALKAKNPNLEFASRFLQLAEQIGPNSDAAAESLVYAIDADRDGPIGDKAADLLARDHVNSHALELLFGSGPLPDDVAAKNLFRSIAERSKKRAYRGEATQILADLLKDSDPKEAGRLYQLVIQKYADVKNFQDFGHRLGEQAQRGLFYVNHLVIGKIAPDFEGKDINGKTIKLSDYRGKIVVVYFCSISCVPCRELYPYWRSLVQRMKDKPFVLIGINSDPPQKASEVIKGENITWPTLWGSSINVEWYVQGWPTIFVIDQQGIIRQHWLGSPGTEVLDRQVQELLKRASKI